VGVEGADAGWTRCDGGLESDERLTGADYICYLTDAVPATWCLRW
jgi:hypothetical protein